jgi:hypothetical protein
MESIAGFHVESLEGLKWLCMKRERLNLHVYTGQTLLGQGLICKSRCAIEEQPSRDAPLIGRHEESGPEEKLSKAQRVKAERVQISDMNFRLL